MSSHHKLYTQKMWWPAWCLILIDHAHAGQRKSTRGKVKVILLHCILIHYFILYLPLFSIGHVTLLLCKVLNSSFLILFSCFSIPIPWNLVSSQRILKRPSNFRFDSSWRDYIEKQKPGKCHAPVSTNWIPPLSPGREVIMITRTNLEDQSPDTHTSTTPTSYHGIMHSQGLWQTYSLLH